MVSSCSGSGQFDTRNKPTYDDGRPNPNYGIPFATLSLDQVYGMVLDPPQMPKPSAQWMLASSYAEPDARTFSVQIEKGSFNWLAVDIDKGSPYLAQVTDALTKALGPCFYMVYSTSSYTAETQKWRALIPLAKPLKYDLYVSYMGALYDELDQAGILADWTMLRAAQLIYLPNRGAEYYHHIQPGDLLEITNKHRLTKAAVKNLAEYQAGLKAVTEASATDGPRSPLGAFRRKHSIESLLYAYGYERKGENWRSPYQSSGGFGTKIMYYIDGERWNSRSESDAAANLGRATKSGRQGDAFDLYTHFSCQGDVEIARRYAQQCLAEEDEARYGAATAIHGRDIYESLYINGVAFGPKPSQADLAEAEARLARLIASTPDPIAPNAEAERYDWKIEWPPGLVGEIAKHIYSNSARPVKQFAIMSALYLVSGMAARKYNIKGKGVNLYMMIAGDSGVGKGEARRAVKKITSALYAETKDPTLLAVFNNDMPSSLKGLARLLTRPENQGLAAVYKEDSDALLTDFATSGNSNFDNLRASITSCWDSGAGLFSGAISNAKIEDSTTSIESPGLTMGLDTQLGSFKGILGNKTFIEGGLSARFLYAPREGLPSYAVEGFDADIKREINPELLHLLKLLWNGIRTNHVTIDVTQTPEMQDAFVRYDYDNVTQQRKDEVTRSFINRGPLLAAKVAALIAIGVNHVAPTATVEHFNWAAALVDKSQGVCLRIINAGEAGSGEAVRMAALLMIAHKYAAFTPKQRRDRKAPKTVVEYGEVIPHAYLIDQCQRNSNFKGDDKGRTTADHIKKTIAEAIEIGELVETTAQAVAERKLVPTFAGIGKLYLLKD